MSSSWIHIWVPTSKYEAELRARSDSIIIESVNKVFSVSTVNHIENSSYETSFSLPSQSPNHEPAYIQAFRPENRVCSSVPIFECGSFEESLEEMLSSTISTSNYTKTTSSNSKYKLFSFSVFNHDVESTLITLQKRCIGSNDFTSVSVVPSSIHIPFKGQSRSDQLNNNNTDDKTVKFYDSIKSRLLVAEVVSRIRAGGEFTFDYLVLVFLAGIIAFMGLVENSSVNLVASMLVSPIMGPILAGIFGSVIQDIALTRQGVKNEVISLLMCLCIGFISTLLLTGAIYAGAYKIDGFWPTPEMIGRGKVRGLYSGVLVAIPSGAGIALSVLGGNSGVLVGVAISASLLPPAVNAGSFWAYALICELSGSALLVGWSGLGSKEFLECSDNFNSSSSSDVLYERMYSCNMSAETFITGLISLALTMVNIICIIVTGFIILKIKEVTPEKIPQTFSTFWKKDVKAHRNYYHTFKHGKTLLSEAEEENIQKDEHERLDGTFIHKIFEQAYNDSDYLNITRWIAFPPPPNV